MKRFSFILCAALAAMVLFVSCKKENAQKTLALEKLTFSETKVSLDPGDEFTLTVNAEPEKAAVGKLNWTSSDESVATVKDGVITAKATGEATITAASGDIKATCKVSISRFILCQMTMNGEAAMKKPIGTKVDWDVDGESHYLILWDTTTGDYIKGNKDAISGEWEDEAVASKFGTVKTDWAKFQYYGVLVVPTKPCESADLTFRYNYTEGVSTSKTYKKTLHIKTSYKENFYFTNASGAIQKAVINVGNTAEKICVSKPNAEGTALEAVKDFTQSHYSFSGSDTNLKVELKAQGEEYYYLSVSKASSGASFTTETSPITFTYNDGSKSSSKRFRFKTSAVNYYDLWF